MTNPFPVVLELLPNHNVRTVVEMGWGGLKNGELLSRSAPDFDAFITVDRNLEHQQNLATLSISVVVLHAQTNELQALVRLLPELERSLESIQPRELVQVGV